MILAGRSRKRNPYEVTILFIPVSVPLEQLVTGWAGRLRRDHPTPVSASVNGIRLLVMGAVESRLTTSITTGSGFIVAAARNCGTTFTFLPLFSLPYTHSACWRAARHLLRRFVEHCSGRRRCRSSRIADRLPDASTVRRWSRGLDCSQPALSLSRPDRHAHSSLAGALSPWRLRNGAIVLDNSGSRKSSGPCVL